MHKFKGINGNSRAWNVSLSFFYCKIPKKEKSWVQCLGFYLFVVFSWVGGEIRAFNNSSVLQGSTNKDYSALSGPCWVGFLLGYLSWHCTCAIPTLHTVVCQVAEEVHCGRCNSSKEELSHKIFAFLFCLCNSRGRYGFKNKLYRRFHFSTIKCQYSH